MLWIVFVVLIVIILAVLPGEGENRAVNEFCNMECKSRRMKKYKFCC